MKFLNADVEIHSLETEVRPDFNPNIAVFLQKAIDINIIISHNSAFMKVPVLRIQSIGDELINVKRREKKSVFLGNFLLLNVDFVQAVFIEFIVVSFIFSDDPIPDSLLFRKKENSLVFKSRQPGLVSVVI